MNRVTASKNLLIFDLDGTLVDSAPEITYCLNQILLKYDLPLKSIFDIKPKIGYPAKLLFEDINSQVSISKLVDEFREILSDVAGSMCSPYPGVKDLLQTLPDKQINSAVATSKPTKIAKKILKNLNLELDFIQGLDNFPPKPDPAILIACISNFKKHAYNSLMIGDTPIDIEAGRNAKVTTVALNHGTRAKRELQESKPDYLFENFKTFSLWFAEEIIEK